VCVIAIPDEQIENGVPIAIEAPRSASSIECFLSPTDPDIWDLRPASLAASTKVVGEEEADGGCM
jgi:hypothetical protein